MSAFTIEDRQRPEAGPALPDPASMPLERVEAEICTLAGQIAAATARFLALLADFDARDGWAGWGVVSCAHWLSWRCGLSLHTAQEQVRVARALRELPKTAEALGQGRISYAKARAICRVGTAETEDELVDCALHNPAAHLDRLVRGLRKARRNLEADERRRGAGSGSDDAPPPWVQWRWDDDGTLKIWGRLSGEDGARLLAGLSRMEQQRLRTADEDATPPPQRCGQVGPAAPTCPQPAPTTAPSQPSTCGVAPADLGPALLAAAELMCTSVEAPVHAPAADVVVHVDADTLARAGLGPDRSADGSPVLDPAAGGVGARIDDGPSLPPEVLQTLACDGRIQLAVHAADGHLLNLGRRRRRPNRAQLDALWRRDRGCAHPGCGRTRFLHAHHVTAWAAGGRSDLDNLILLCGQHHRALHDGAFAIVALGRQRFRFHGPHGAERPRAPQTRGNLTVLTDSHPHITPTTIEPDWDGTPLDLPHATDVFLHNWAVKGAGRPVGTGQPSSGMPPE